MEEKIYETSPSYGYIKPEFQRFNDKKKFVGRTYLLASLYKIKIWHGTPANGLYKKGCKAILGIECWYKSMGKKQKESERHLGLIESSDVNTKVFELADNDFFSKCYMCYDDIITYIKLVSFKGKTFEIGDKTTERNISINDREKPHIIQYLFGFLDNCGLRALGFRHAPRFEMIIMNNIGLLRLRHMIKKDAKKNEYWSNENNLKKLDIPMRAIAKLVYLPDYPFSVVYQFFI